MTGFFIKKAFFDGWDHLWGLVALNLGSLLILVLFTVLPLNLGFPFPAMWLGLGFVLYIAYATVSAAVLRDAAEYRDVRIAALGPAIRSQGLAGLLYGILLTAAVGVFLVALPFYSTRGTFLAWFALGTVFWCLTAVLLALQWFPAVRALLPGSLPSSLAKCFFLLADNLGFSVFLGVYTLAGLVLSVLAALLVPGVAGTTLGTVDALRLLMKKYDWLEAHPRAERKSIPWGEILEEERELVGKRSLKGMIFPWKE